MGKKQLNKSIPHTKHDHIMKYLIENREQEFSDMLNLNYKFIRLIPTENIDLLERAFQMDCLIEVEDKEKNKKLINIEFQSGQLTKEKIKIITAYNILSDIKHKLEVLSVILHIEYVEEDEIIKEVNQRINLKYQNKTLKLDSYKILNTIENKIANNEQLTKKEILIFH